MNIYERFRALRSIMDEYALDWDDLIDAGFTRGMYDMLAAEHARLVESGEAQEDPALYEIYRREFDNMFR